MGANLSSSGVSADGVDSAVMPVDRGPTQPLSAMGPDCYREVITPQNNNNIAALLVSRDETVSGWTIVQLPGREATITCNGQTMTGTPNWFNFAYGGIRFGLVDITSIYVANEDVHVEYEYDSDTFTEDFLF